MGKIGIHTIFELLKGYQTYNVPPEVALLYHFRVPHLYNFYSPKGRQNGQVFFRFVGSD